MKLFSYEVLIQSSIVTEHPEQIAQFLKTFGTKCALIADVALVDLYATSFNEALCLHGLDSALFSFNAKEPYKTRATKEMLEDSLFEQGFGRDSVIIALGGGVVSDVVGFVASTYCRGVAYVIIPTTLLAMCDASIGGKTGVNTPYGKNTIGTIYQPKKVYIDPSVLSSLSQEELMNGVAEMIKHAIIADKEYFEFLEQNHKHLFEPSLLEKAISKSIRIKKEIVEADECETGKRAFLNFGHTVGHALEKISGYTMAHGKAVAIGMVMESKMAHALGVLSAEELERICHLIQAFSLPTEPPFPVSKQQLYVAMKGDKKSVRGVPRFVLIEAIGRAKECVPINL